LELGALVAFLSAQEKLYDPWKELIQFYQAYQTASVTYSRTMEYFNVEPEHQLVPKGRQPYELEGSIEVNDLSFVVADGTQLLSEIDFDLKHGEHMALVGFSGSGKSTLAQCIAQLYKYTGGKILIDQKEVSQLSKEDITQTVGFVSQTPFIFEGSIDENLQYAVMAKAEKAQADGQPKMPSLDDRIMVLQQTGLFIDVLRFGLNAVLDRNKHKDIMGEILNVRKTFRQNFGEDLEEFIEFYDSDNYLYNSSVAENILFGDPLDDAFNAKNLPQRRRLTSGFSIQGFASSTS
jgi:ABC-type bacteriocin/lantibiotic exporter with double-glycine peptidase domain